jgi:hypothetical protein
MNCSRCQGSVVTPDKPPKRKQEKLSFREIERMMQSANTYERRGGRLRQSSPHAPLRVLGKLESTLLFLCFRLLTQTNLRHLDNVTECRKRGCLISHCNMADGTAHSTVVGLAHWRTTGHSPIDAGKSPSSLIRHVSDEPMLSQVRTWRFSRPPRGRFGSRR